MRSERRAWSSLTRLASAFAALLVTAAFCLSVPAPAFAASTYSLRAPAAGSTVLPPSVVSVRVDADSDVVSATMTIDGQPVPSVWNPVERWEKIDDEWFTFVDDYSIVNVAYAPGALTVGTHTVSVTVQTALSGPSTGTWSFDVESAPTISSVSPLGTSALSLLSPLITATVSDDDPSFTASMTVDGVQVTPTYDGATKTYFYLPLALADNVTHTVWFRATDLHGISATRTWTFRTAVVPYLTALVPSSGTTATTLRPMIGLTMSDGAPDPLAVVLRLDGSVVFSGSVAQGAWGWTPTFDLTNNASHSVRAEVTDGDSNTSVAEWTFNVASNTVFSNISPTPGATVLSPGTAYISAHSDVDITGATALIDGVAVPWYNVLVTWPDGYDERINGQYTGEWIVEDAGVVDVSIATGGLSHGPHTVSVTFQTASGPAPSQTWSFNVDSAPVIAAVTPAVGMRTPDLTPEISARISDDDSTFGCAMTVDGVSVTPAWDPSTTTFAYTPSVPFADNSSHTAAVTVTDPDGFSGSRSWTFSTHVKPSLTAPVPANGSSVSVACPPIGVTTWDDIAGPMQMVLELDDAVVYSAPVEQGPWTWTPVGALRSGIHTVRAEITDSEGVTSELSWSLTVEAAPPVTASDCRTCHDYRQHPDTDCGNVKCHGLRHESEPCSDCHPGNEPGHNGNEFDGGTFVKHGITRTRRQCVDCHPGHAATLDAVHAFSAMPASCSGCHSNSLIAEHRKYPYGWATTYDCAVCHLSANLTVRAAITANDISCDACHGAAADHIATHTTTTIKPSCSLPGCHASDLVTEHAGHGVTCADCHGISFAVSGATSGLRVGGAGARVEGADPMPSAEGTLAPVGMVAAATIVFDPHDAVNSGNLACEACHAPNTHGSREDCFTCHGAIAPTADGSEPSSTATAGDYRSWSTTQGLNAVLPTPHKGYQTATAKCAICHSVHRAPLSGRALLRGTAEAACEFCHVYTNVGGIVIYGGDDTVYSAIHDDFSHNRTSDSSCTSCHSVHGANTLEGANADKILWDWAKIGTRSYSKEATATWPDPSTVANDQEQITAWCTGCHSYYVGTYETTIAVSSFEHSSTYAFTSRPGRVHVMRPSDSYGNPTADPSVQGTRISWKDSTTCRSCHDAGGTDLGPGVHESSFPHSTPGYYRFMIKAESRTGASQENTAGPVDGLCLKCHREDVSTGVGGSY